MRNNPRQKKPYFHLYLGTIGVVGTIEKEGDTIKKTDERSIWSMICGAIEHNPEVAGTNIKNFLNWSELSKEKKQGMARSKEILSTELTEAQISILLKQIDPLFEDFGKVDELILHGDEEDRYQLNEYFKSCGAGHHPVTIFFPFPQLVLGILDKLERRGMGLPKTKEGYEIFGLDSLRRPDADVDNLAFAFDVDGTIFSDNINNQAITWLQKQNIEYTIQKTKEGWRSCPNLKKQIGEEKYKNLLKYIETKCRPIESPSGRTWEEIFSNLVVREIPFGFVTFNPFDELTRDLLATLVPKGFECKIIGGLPADPNNTNTTKNDHLSQWMQESGIDIDKKGQVTFVDDSWKNIDGASKEGYVTIQATDGGKHIDILLGKLGVEAAPIILANPVGCEELPNEPRTIIFGFDCLVHLPDDFPGKLEVAVSALSGDVKYKYLDVLIQYLNELAGIGDQGTLKAIVDTRNKDQSSGEAVQGLINPRQAQYLSDFKGKAVKDLWDKVQQGVRLISVQPAETEERIDLLAEGKREKKKNEGAAKEWNTLLRSLLDLGYKIGIASDFGSPELTRYMLKELGIKEDILDNNAMEIAAYRYKKNKTPREMLERTCEFSQEMNPDKEGAAVVVVDTNTDFLRLIAQQKGGILGVEATSAGDYIGTLKEIVKLEKREEGERQGNKVDVGASSSSTPTFMFRFKNPYCSRVSPTNPPDVSDIEKWDEESMAPYRAIEKACAEVYQDEIEFLISILEREGFRDKYETALMLKNCYCSISNDIMRYPIRLENCTKSNDGGMVLETEQSGRKVIKENIQTANLGYQVASKHTQYVYDVEKAKYICDFLYSALVLEWASKQDELGGQVKPSEDDLIILHRKLIAERASWQETNIKTSEAAVSPDGDDTGLSSQPPGGSGVSFFSDRNSSRPSSSGVWVESAAENNKLF